MTAATSSSLQDQRFEIHHNHKIGEATYDTIIKTYHAEGIEATTAFFGTTYTKSMGGTRFITDADHKGFVEVAKLSKGMAEKSFASEIPCSGQKSVILVPEHVFADDQKKADILAQHARLVLKYKPGAIWGPDMGADENVMSLVYKQIGNHVTGLLDRDGGYSIDKRSFTAIGLAETFGFMRDVQTVVVQGFGAVGMNIARLATERGYVVRAVNNINATLISKSNQGLPIKKLIALRNIHGDDFVTRLDDPDIIVAPVPDIFTISCDIFIPAARTEVLATRTEIEDGRVANPDCVAVEDFFAGANPKYILEAANAPITVRAEDWLHELGVIIFPDFIVNSGGLIGCYLEYVNREKGIIREPTDKQIDDALERLRKTVATNTQMMLEINLSPRAAAQEIIRRRQITSP